MNRFLPFLILAFLLGLIALSTYNLNRQQKNEIPQDDENFGIHFVKTEIALPEFSLANLIDGESDFSKKDFLGKKYSLVNFFASWCTTCRAEHEILMRIKSSGIVDIYGVAWHDIKDSTKNYLEKNGNPFIKVALDSKGILGSEANIRAIPETWIVDEEGKVVSIFRGNLQDFSVAEIQSIILK